MHDLHAADKIMKLVLDQAAQNRLKNIKRIEIDLGTVVEHGAAISPENLQYNIKLLSKNTLAAKALVVVNETTGHELRLKEIEGDPLSQRQ